MGRFDRLPGIDENNTRRRSVLIGAGYALAGSVGLGAVVRDPGGGDTQGGGDGGNGGTGGGDTASSTAAPTATEAETDTDSETASDSPPAEPEAVFEVGSIEVPDGVGVGEEHRIRVTVRNVGDATGSYEGTLELSAESVDTWADAGEIIVPDVDPDDTGTITTVPFSYDSPRTVQLRVDDAQAAYDVAPPDISPQSFRGTDEAVREGITIEDGLTVAEATHAGEGNFQVELAGGGEFSNLLVNVTGSFDGSHAEYVDADEYILDVNADGPWSVTLRQPRAWSGESLPRDASGSSPAVVGPLELSGTSIARGTHEGTGNFQVQLYEQGAQFAEVLFNEFGQFDGDTTFSADGIGWVDVNAEGPWSLSVE